MAVTAFIDRVKAASANRGPSDAELGLDMGMGGAGVQVPMGIPTSGVAGVESRYIENPELAMEYLKEIYQPLKRHYEWFRRTQRGQIKQYSRQARSRNEAYRWRGRSQLHVLTSGMDDYPRGPAHAGELHLDLISWVGFFSRTMREIAAFIGENDDEVTFAKIEQDVLNNIEGAYNFLKYLLARLNLTADMHWDESEKMYCDLNVDDEGKNRSSHHFEHTSHCYAQDESYAVCHKGYLSLFPFLLEHLSPTSPHLGHILDLVHDPQHLWSPYGIRSLSLSHPEFGKGENYWKGPIWIQINYLALRALKKVSRATTFNNFFRCSRNL